MGELFTFLQVQLRLLKIYCFFLICSLPLLENEKGGNKLYRTLFFTSIITSLTRNHRNQTISRKGANIISRRPSHGHLARRCRPQAFLQIFSEVTYIRTVGNSTLLKIYTLPNHTITIGICILETQLLGLL
jgi:hypothetical protein